jgi:hypothetical protein
MGMAAGARLWTSYCVFPWADWNTIRLAPTFMLGSGQTPYPGLAGDALTTWIYGPVPLFTQLPATLAASTAPALLIADGTNLLWNLVPLALAIWAATKTSLDDAPGLRVWAFLLCLAVWPNSSLQYLQADNIAIAFGLVSNLLLTRARPGGAPAAMAALGAALAVWSKQTSLGLILAQLIWLLLSVGWRAAVRHALWGTLFGGSIGALFIARFGFAPLWLNLVEVPGHIPLCADLWQRTRELAPHLAGYVLLPAAGVMVFRRSVWRRNSMWLLPALTWLCLLPTSVISVYKIGGTSNSLNGFLYLLVPASLALVVWIQRWNLRVASIGLAVLAMVVSLQQLALSPRIAWQPLTQHLQEADELARQFPGEIYFPWNTLVTYFTDHRFYHAEDGIYTRHIAGFGSEATVLRRNLPPRWSKTAVLG